MRFTSPLTYRRREAIAIAARERINAGTLRLQRNAYRDHAMRLTEALADVNRAWAAPPTDPASAPWSPQESARVSHALRDANALAAMILAYDETQRTTDSTIQEN